MARVVGYVARARHLVEQSLNHQVVSTVNTDVCVDFLSLQVVESLPIVLLNWVLELNCSLVIRRLAALIKRPRRVLVHELSQVDLVILRVAQLFFFISRQFLVVLVIFIKELATAFEFLIKIVASYSRIVPIIECFIRPAEVPQERVAHHFSIQSPRQRTTPVDVEDSRIESVQS